MSDKNSRDNIMRSLLDNSFFKSAGGTSLSDIASIFLLKHINAGNLWLNYLINIIYYLMFNAIPLCFYICLYYLSERTHVMPKKRYWTFFGLYIFISILLFSTPLTHLVFWFDENYMLRYGIFFYAYYALALFYMGAGIIHFLNHRNLFSMNQIISLISFVFFCFLSTIFQMIYPKYVITGFMLAITILLTYLSLENPDDYIDFETGVYNNLAFLVKAQEYFEDKKNMYILGLTSDNLSHILRSIGETNKRMFYNKVFSFLKETFQQENIFRVTYEKFAIMLPDTDAVLS